MDQELKQRLIGAVVVTALAAIFIPMLFDDPVETSGKEVTEISVPPPPAPVVPETAQNLPQNKDQVLNRSDIDLKATEVEEVNPGNGLDSQAMPQPGERTEQPLAEGNANLAANPSAGAAKDKASSQVAGSGLDTGYVGDAGGSESGGAAANNAVDPDNTAQPVIAAPVEKPVSKPVKKEKPNNVAAHHVEKTKEKLKHPETQEGNKVSKPSSKLARYSIQAGSFNKRENAEALAAKLRKQGMPTTIISKGDFFRVKIGPSLDKAKARDMKAKLDKMNINGLLVSE